MSGVALVTGGTRGIGRCIAVKLLGMGYKVFVTYARDESAAASFMAEFPDLTAVQLDGRCIDQVQVLRDQMLAEGAVTVLVNNAGITGDGIFLNASHEAFNKVMDANFGSTLNYCNVFASVMASARFGNIINISSVAATKAKLGNTAYGCAKAAIERLTLGLALELARFDVKVNCIAPGFVDTHMFEEFAQGGERDILKTIPGRKIMMPEEVANMVILLVSRQFNTTGTILKVGNGENIA
jgi:NAD(P)-dependent dehydrogenase (short-subunit alcohol dehydrogenase family)